MPAVRAGLRRPEKPESDQPNDLVAGPDGNLWFTESTLHGGVIGRITPGGTITTFVFPEVHEQVSEIDSPSARCVGKERTRAIISQAEAATARTSLRSTVTPGIGLLPTLSVREAALAFSSVS